MLRSGVREMAYQYALNRLFVVTANMGTLFENVSGLLDLEREGARMHVLQLLASGLGLWLNPAHAEYPSSLQVYPPPTLVYMEKCSRELG